MLTKHVSPAPWFTEQLKKHKGMNDVHYHIRGALFGDADRPGAFVGAHNENGLMLTFDEGFRHSSPDLESGGWIFYGEVHLSILVCIF